MNWTDSARAKAWFRKYVLPEANRLKAAGTEVFPMRPDPAADSYYETRDSDSPLGPADFELLGDDTARDFSMMLKELWESQGHAKLAEGADSLAKLADRLHTEQQQSEEVSPFIYVMF